MGQTIQFNNEDENIRLHSQFASGDMYVRELMQNALEAVEGRDEGLIDWFCGEHEGTPKLCIKNNGRSMGPRKLQDVLLNIGKSGEEKEFGIHGNFGRGAKLTILAAMRNGAIYTSCHDRRVYRAWLRWEDDLPCVHSWEVEDDDGYACEEMVVDVTNEYSEQQIENNWVEVMLLGDNASHNTVDEPFAWGSKEKVYWLPEYLNHRYADLESISKVRVRTSQSAYRTVRGMDYQPKDRVSFFDCGDFSVKYLLMPRGGASDRGAHQPFGYCCHGAIVYQNELYDGCFGAAWQSRARQFGIPFGASRVVIQIVIKNDEFCRPEEQRRNLHVHGSDGRSRELMLSHFQEEILAGRPQWLLDYVAESRPKQLEQTPQQKKRIQEMMDMLKHSHQIKKPDENGDELVGNRRTESSQGQGGGSSGNGGSNNRSNDTDAIEKHRGTGIDRHKNAVPPEIVWVGTDHDSYRYVENRLASYDETGHLITVNADDVSIVNAVEVIAKDYSIEYQPEILQKVKEEVELSLTELVTNAYLQKRRGGKNWTVKDLQSSFSNESLTVAAGSLYRLVKGASQRLRYLGGKSDA